MQEEIINKVADSGLLTLDLAAYLPAEEVIPFDLKDFLFRGLILKEKDFREALKTLAWEPYRGKTIAVSCSVDAIIPPWAYMLVATYLQPVAKDVLMGTRSEVERQLFLSNIRGIDTTPFTDQRVVVKGCGDQPIGDFAYMEIAKLLRPVAKSVMYGEPCSTVPVFKKR